MNSMLANVTARIREIGIRKALGATKREIRTQFLTEAVFISLSGGIVGTMLGLALAAGVSTCSRRFTFHLDLVRHHRTLHQHVGRHRLRYGTREPCASLDPVETLKYE